MSQKQPPDLRMTVFAALFTALIVIGGYLSFPIPLSPVPIVLSDFFVMLAGLFLGAAWGAASVGLLLFLGALGLPVFAGGNAGLGHFLSPGGGYLIGFLVAVYVIGLIAGQRKPSLIKDILALIAGNIIIYLIGVPWLKMVLKCAWDKAIVFGLLPFIIGIILKIIIGVSIIQIFRPLLKQTIPALAQHPDQPGN